MRFETPTDLPKLGTRPYIQGGSIFNGIVDFCDEALGPGWLQDAVVASFKLQRESTANGRFVLSDAALGELDPNAAFVARRPQGRLFAYYIDEGAATRCEPYDEGSYYRVVRIGAALDGQFVLPAGQPRAHFMRGVVGANKLVHQETRRFDGELTHIQFLYLKELDALCLLKSAEEIHLGITNVSVQEHPREVWSINRVAVQGVSFSSEFRICYRAAKQGR